MFDLVFMFFRNPMTLLVMVLAVAALVGTFIIRPEVARKIALDGRTWVILAVIGGVAGFHHLTQENKRLEAKIQTAEHVEDAKADAVRTIREHHARKVIRQTETERLNEIIDNAPPEQAHDVVLDEIARLQGDPVVAPDPGAGVPPVLEPGGLPDTAPDGVVVP